MRDKNILALDLSYTTGWAFSGSSVIESGVVRFTMKKDRITMPDDHIGLRFDQFNSWLKGMIFDYSVNHIVFEECMGYGMKTYALQCNMGLRAIMLMEASQYEIPVSSYTQTELKKFATGNGRAGKPQIVSSASERWPLENFETDDECDARFLLEMALTGK